MRGKREGKARFAAFGSLCGVLFCALIAVIGLMDALWPRRAFSELENRKLAADPVFTWEKLWENEYTLEYEAYIGDQFMLRDSWIDLKSRMEFVFGKLENNGVLYGEDGYQFEKLAPVEEERVQSAVGFISRFAASLPQGEFYFGLVPNAYEVLADKVPAAAPLPKQDPWITRIYDELPVSTRTVDMTRALSSHKDEQIFYRTDHHWTTQGAYYGYEAYCEAAGLTPVSLSELEKRQVEGFYGTLYSKSKLFSTEGETMEYYLTDPVSMRIKTLEGEKIKDGLYDLPQFEKRDKYAAFLYSNNDLTKIERRERDAERERLLIIKDSYSNSMIPFLTENYNEIYVVDLRSLSVPMSEILKETEFDDVLLLYNFKNFVTDPNLARLAW